MSHLEALHPEYLADRAREGALGPGERRQLGAHIAACNVCAWEATAIDDFARARAGAIDEARLARLVDGALAKLPSAKKSQSVARRPRAAIAGWIAAFAMVSAAVIVFVALPSRSAREGAHSAPAAIGPSDVALDAGAIGSAGGDS